MINSVEIDVWGRRFVLNVEYGCYKGDIVTVTQDQVSAFELFLIHKEWLNGAKESVEKYCKKAVMNDEENSKKENVFSYVKPEYLYVKCGNNGAVVALLCKYRYDPEHGLAIVFSEDGKIEVGGQDIL